MELIGSYLMALIETGGIFAPLLFISFHLLRPLFFLPVILICISGGALFGVFAGTIYSIIGITLSSILFYFTIQWMPKTFNKLVRVKQRVVGKHSVMTTPQITLLRLIPFIHFQLLSICLIETYPDMKDYTKSSLVSSIPVAIVYTTIGQSISKLSPIKILLLTIAIIPLIYIFRRKETSIKWHEFFQLKTYEMN